MITPYGAHQDSHVQRSMAEVRSDFDCQCYRQPCRQSTPMATESARQPGGKLKSGFSAVKGLSFPYFQPPMLGCPILRALCEGWEKQMVRVSVLERSLHFGPRTSITTALRSKGLGIVLSCSCTLKYANSRGRGNVVIPKGFPRSVGRVESRPLGFPCFPYSVISMACFGNAFHKVTITAKAHFGNRNRLSEMATIWQRASHLSMSELAIMRLLTF
jgi:hypothetical protein